MINPKSRHPYIFAEFDRYDFTPEEGELLELYRRMSSYQMDLLNYVRKSKGWSMRTPLFQFQTYNALVKKGFIESKGFPGTKGYRITDKGRKILSLDAEAR